MPPPNVKMRQYMTYAYFKGCKKSDNIKIIVARNGWISIHCTTGSKKVSGRSGSNVSLQYITVTRSSVSERLMML